MSNVFAISDHHFGHFSILSFMNKDGGKLRPFETLEEMHEVMVDRHNSVVRDCDKVYFGGDIAMKLSGLEVLKRLKGKKRLILGNHDVGDMKEYLPYFEAVYSSRLLDRMLFTHIPVHEGSIGKSKANIFGHTHDHKQGLLGPKYFCMCAEALRI